MTERAPKLVEHGVAQDLSLIKPQHRSGMIQYDLFGESKSKKALQRMQNNVLRNKPGLSFIWTQSRLWTMYIRPCFSKNKGKPLLLRELLFYEKHYRPDFVGVGLRSLQCE